MDTNKSPSPSKSGRRKFELQPIPDISSRQSPLKQPSSSARDSSNEGSKWIFTLFLISNLLINYDGGVIPASLVQIESELKITYTQEAALGSIVYIGLSAASLFVSPTFKRFQAKNVLGFMLLAKAVTCALFAYLTNLLLLYACRVLMGVTQAFCVIYAPVWVNGFSPKDKNTTWMGILHAFVPIGIMLGFMVAAIVINYFPDMLTWRFAIQLQAVCEVPVAIIFFFQDNKKIDVLADMKHPSQSYSNTANTGLVEEKEVRMDTISYNNYQDIISQIKMVLSNKTLVFTSLSLCSLFYVVTGVQYWSSLYMIKILNMSPNIAMLSFGFIATTAPLAGVFVGGLTSDALGGYKGDNILTAVKLCSAYAIVAFLISMPVSAVTKLWFFMPLLWALLFFGACILPAATGIIVDCVPREFQAANSSFSQLLYNIFGYFMAPVFSAIIMDRFSNEEEGLIWGFRSVVWFSIFGVIFILINWWYVSSDIENYKEMREESERKHTNLSTAEKLISQIKFEVARRRAVSFL